MDTDEEFKEMTGTGIDEVDAEVLVEVGEEDPEVETVSTGSFMEDEEGETEDTDEMLDYIYGEQLNSR